MKTLFKLDSKGKIRQLEIWAEDGRVARLAGIRGGNLVATGKDCVGKNIGRANETTPEEQAELEAAAEITKKIREGYVSIGNHKEFTDEEIIAYIKENSIQIPDCMLAKPYKSKYADWENGVLVSRKLDGMRCMAVITATEVTLYSRGRKEITTMTHIQEELEALSKETGFTGILDGELYYHDTEADNFQDIMKACKKYRAGISEQVEYHVYDIIVTNFSAEDRFYRYRQVIEDYNRTIADQGNLKIVRQSLAYSEKEAMKWHARYVSAGYEGTMLKNAHSEYRQGARSSDLLKFKDFQDAEYEVIDIEPMAAAPQQGLAILKCYKTGLTFKATPKMTHSERAELLINKDKYKGAVATVQFFGYTDKGLPRLPVLKSFTFPEDLEAFRIAQAKG